MVIFAVFIRSHYNNYTSREIKLAYLLFPHTHRKNVDIYFKNIYSKINKSEYRKYTITVNGNYRSLYKITL